MLQWKKAFCLIFASLLLLPVVGCEQQSIMQSTIPTTRQSTPTTTNVSAGKTTISTTQQTATTTAQSPAANTNPTTVTTTRQTTVVTTEAPTSKSAATTVVTTKPTTTVTITTPTAETVVTTTRSTAPVSRGNGTLVVLGKEITDDVYTHVHADLRHADLPVVTILEALDIPVKWHTPFEATVTIEEKDYELNTKECILRVENGGNIFTPVPGGKRYYQTLEYELMLDSLTTKTLLRMFLGCDILVDYENSVVKIVELEDS